MSYAGSKKEGVGALAVAPRSYAQHPPRLITLIWPRLARTVSLPTQAGLPHEMAGKAGFEPASVSLTGRRLTVGRLASEDGVPGRNRTCYARGRQIYSLDAGPFRRPTREVETGNRVELFSRGLQPRA